MSSWLGPALLAITKGRSAQLAGQQQTKANEDAVKMQQIQMAIQAAQRKQQAAAQEASQQRLQATLDETMRHNQAVEAAAANKPTAPVFGSPEWLAAKEKEAQIGAKYAYHPPREAPGAAAIALESWKQQHPDAAQKSSKPLTESQAKAASFLQLAEADEPTIQQMTSNSLPNKMIGKVPILGNMVIGAEHPEYQTQMAAADRFVNQYLRFQSGATITPSEFEQAKKQLIPQPGDTPETVAQKQAARQRVLEGLRTAAGNAGGAGATPDLVPNDKPMSDADKWEQFRAQGMSPAQATAAVLKSKGKK